MHTRVLRSVRTVHSEQRFDLVLRQGQIAAIEKSGTAAGDEIINCSGQYVSSGWIDMHVHAMDTYQPYGDDADKIGVSQGVTTILDAGSCGADHMEELYRLSRTAETRLLALLNISRIGLGLRQDELSRAEWIDQQLAVETAARYSGFIVGLKARISRSVVKEEGISPLNAALRISEQVHLPLMVHIGSGPPGINEVLNGLRERDIVTHYLHGKANNILDDKNELIPDLKSAIRRGVHLDVGHGTASFSFRVAEIAKDCGVHPDTISSDIYRGNRLNGPVHSLADVMTKFMVIGYTLAEVIDRVTIRAADWLGRPELGRIQVGDEANLTLFEVVPESRTMIDSNGDTRLAESVIQPKGAIIGGNFYSS
ncbi:amidohydrolase/deacetylase family metallohydrolase [Paenibacillus sp. 453mf]|uniref:amidohydrolase/deacetylase family metallohydrolase n=1 Tax=Paenibacillus sp. 453mf TaxID=1761874 RepID=UPI0008E1B460|nr:amidohydrolase/deacetylase family metallohydrolase [Paenibacillus sp. 453mf]SFS49713.1 dihydroorotase [Paenibacillus sp. 453mf]